MKIYLDFDGTVVEHCWPQMGRPIKNAIEVISLLAKAGHEIIINTARVDYDGMDEVMQMFKWPERLIMNPNRREAIAIDNYLGLDNKITTHTPTKIHPPKYDLKQAITDGILFIDDISYGTPLMKSGFGNPDYVNWEQLEKDFREHGIIK